ncbi:TolC family protein [Myroides sp. LoEW2-1]|uniref:TolC family protein n=1 Tax=Myroides sp. LoEW2-1 TaxID=2683192 RepID=UPI00132A872C|nr:TolC family protein [Myroides sp. LoEW2-1]MVX35094.1 TolC family protein [Myroides sp. LoEW2-1]
MKMNKLALFILFGIASSAYAQKLTLQQAIEQTTQEYDLLKVKEAKLKALQQNTTYTQGNYFPDLTFGAQQSYGTINAQNGPLYAYGGLGSASTSMPLAEQNWNAAFGSLYFANINWNVFSFGKTRQQVKMAKAQERVSLEDLNQEVFKQQIKVGATYLNLLAAQRIKFVQEQNLQRAKVFYEVTKANADSGLIAQVDEQLAQAELANAQALYLKAYDKEIEYQKALAVLLNQTTMPYQLDEVFTISQPNIAEGLSNEVVEHPILQLHQSQIDQSKVMEKLIVKGSLPTLNAFGIIQGRGSGFEWNYVQDNTAFTRNYSNGVGIDRSNYLVGLTLTWNITNFFKTTSKRKEQEQFTNSLSYQYSRMSKELENQQKLAAEKFVNAQDILGQTKIQVSAASTAFAQQKALYENGLSNLVDFTQALYTLQRAEIDFEIAQNNVWQALLLESSAKGDINYLLNAIPQK